MAEEIGTPVPETKPDYDRLMQDYLSAMKAGPVAPVAAPAPIAAAPAPAPVIGPEVIRGMERTSQTIPETAAIPVIRGMRQTLEVPPSELTPTVIRGMEPTPVEAPAPTPAPIPAEPPKPVAAPLPQAIAPTPRTAQPAGAPTPPPEAPAQVGLPAPAAEITPPAQAKQPTDIWDSIFYTTQEGGVGQFNRFAAGLVNPVLEMAHGLARGAEKTINLATGQSPDWTWQNSPTGALTAFTGWLKQTAAPHLPKEDEPISRFTSNLLGSLASFMVVPAAFKMTGAALPMNAAGQIFGKGISTADRVTALGQNLGTNLLNFGIVDVSQAIGRGGDLDDARDALARSIPTAALFTVAGALPFDKVAKSPWLVKAMESTATGTAFAGSAGIQGERDPYALATSFLTGFGLHALTSGGPMALDIYQRNQGEKALKAWQKQVDDYYNKYTIDWKETNNINKPEWEKIQEIINQIVQKPVETGEAAMPEAGPPVLDAQGRPVQAPRPEVEAALAKQPWERNAEEKLLADQAEKEARARQPLTPEAAGPAPEIVPGEPGYRPRADIGETAVDQLTRAVDIAGDTEAGRRLGDILATNQNSIANAFRVNEVNPRPDLEEVIGRIGDLSRQVEETGDPNAAKALSDYIGNNLELMKGLQVIPWAERAQAPAVRPGEATPALTPTLEGKAPERPPKRPSTPIGVAGNEAEGVATAKEAKPEPPKIPAAEELAKMDDDQLAELAKKLEDAGITGGMFSLAPKPEGAKPPVPGTPQAASKPALERLMELRQQAREAGAPAGTALIPGTKQFNEWLTQKSKPPEEPKTPAAPVGTAGGETQDVATKAPAPLPPGVRESLNKYGTARIVGKPEGLLTGEGKVPGEIPDPTEPGISYSTEFPRELINLNPTLWQHKLGSDVRGGGLALMGVREKSQWKPQSTGLISLYRYPDGRVELMDGHQRLSAGDRVGIENHKVQIFDGNIWSIEQARTEAALINLRAGTGTPVDSAKAMRDFAITPEELKAQGADMTKEHARVALGLATLTDRIFTDVANGKFPIEKGAVIGRELVDRPEAQDAIYAIALKRQEAGTPIPEAKLQEMIRFGKYAEVVPTQQGSLPGFKEVINKALVEENVDLMTFAKDQLRRERTIFSAAVRNEARLSEAGNRLDPETNRMISAEAGEGIHILEQAAWMPGTETNRLFNEYAAKLNEGKNKPAIRKAFYEQIPKALEADRATIGLGERFGENLRSAEPTPPAQRPETGAGEAGPEDTGPGLFSLGLTGEIRPLTKFEQRLKSVLDEHPDADPGRAALALRGNPKATNEQIALLSKVGEETAKSMTAANNAALLRQAEAARAGAGTNDPMIGVKFADGKVEEFWKDELVAKEKANVEKGQPAQGAAPEPQDRLSRLSEAGEGRSRELADFQSRRGASLAGDDPELAIYQGLKPAGDTFAESPTFKNIQAEAQGRGIKRVIAVADAPFESVLVPDGDGHTLLVNETAERGTHTQLAGHEFFHHDVEIGDPKAEHLYLTAKTDSPAFKAYADTLNRLRVSMGLAALSEKAMAIEVAADYANGLSRLDADGRDIDLANAFFSGEGEQALANYRGEIVPKGTAILPAEPRGPPRNLRPANPEKLNWPPDRVSRQWTTVGYDKNGWPVTVRKAPGKAFIKEPAWEVESSGGGGIRRFSDQNMAREFAAKFLDSKQMAKQGYDVERLFAAPDEFKHLRAQAPDFEKGVTERSKKTGEVISEQKPLFSLAPGEERQGWIDTSEPLTLKQFETRLEENDGELWKRITDPASKMIPLYAGERYVGTRGGNVIENARGTKVVLSKEDVYERLFNPKKQTLPLGTETARPEDLLGTPEKPGPEGTIEMPPDLGKRTALRVIRENLAAASISEKADFTHQAVIKNSGWAARDMAEKAKVLDRFSSLFDKMSREELTAWTDAVESKGDDAATMTDPRTGEEVPIPKELQELSKIWRRMDNGLHFIRAMLKEEAVEEAESSGRPVENPETAYWENHYPRLFKNPEMAAVLIRRTFGSSLTGPEGFNNIRTQLLLSDSIKPKLVVQENENGSFDVVQKDIYGEKPDKTVENFPDRAAAEAMVKEKGGLGLEPLTTNYAEMMKGALWEQLRYINGKLIENDLKDAGFMSRKEVPGWERYQGDKTLEGYYIHPDAARVMDNFLSRGLRGNPLFEFWNTPATFFNGVMVSASFFHASLSIFSSLALGVGSNLTRAVGAAMTGRFALAGHHLAELAKTGAIPLELVKGSRMLKEYVEKGLFPQYSDMIDLMTKGGIRGETRSFGEVLKAVWKTGQIDKSEISMISKAFDQVYKDGQLGLPRRLLDVVAWPIMGYVVPRLKIAATFKLLQLHLDEAANQGIKLTEAQQVKLAQECSRKADNIFGQMVYDNLSMTRGFRDALRIFIGFPGWNIGSLTDILQAGQGITHMVGQAGKIGAEAITGRKPTWEAMSRSSRMSLEFYLGTVAVVSLFGALTQRLLTGDWPDTIKDLMMPRTGALMANGQPERMRMPTYLRDVLSLNHPIEMIQHKENWPLRMFSALVTNKDFFGEQIRDPFAGGGEQAGQVAKFVGKSLTPFAMQGAAATQSPAAARLNYLGITRVPRIYSNTAAMNLIDQYNEMNRASMTSKEAAEEKRLKAELREFAHNQDQNGFQGAATKAMQEGKLSHQQIKAIVDQSQAPPGMERFVGLPLEWQVRALTEATPEEKALWEPYFLKKVMGAKPEMLVRTKEQLAPILRQMGYDDTADQIESLEIPEHATHMDLAHLGLQGPGVHPMGAGADYAMAQNVRTNLEKLGIPAKERSGRSPSTIEKGGVRRKKESPYSILGF